MIGPSPAAPTSGAERELAEDAKSDSLGSGERSPRTNAVDAELAGTLHEVSNALTVVLGWLDAAERARDADEVHRALDVARQHARRGQLIARRAIGAEVDSQKGGRTALELADFARTSIRPRADEQGVDLVLEVDGGADVVIHGDDQALQVLTNLLLNAIDFSPEAGAVTLEVRREGAEVVFAVHDQGPGISPDRRATLFSNPVSTRQGGAGIGLPHSRSIARERGGDLRLVPSERGSSFELVWPVERAAPLRPSQRVPSPLSLDGLRVLLVEDDPAVSSLVELSLEARGAQVLAVDSPEALTNVLAGRPVIDAMLLDLSPVEGRVREVLDDIAERAPDAPVLLVSGAPEGVPAEAEGRFAAWVRKPFDVGELLGTLTDVLPPR